MGRIKKKDIKTGDWVCLDNMPVFGTLTLGEIAKKWPQIANKRYFKVIGKFPLRCSITWRNADYFKDIFNVKLKWITDIKKSYNEVIKERDKK
jgi:hypothetical protein